MKADPSPAAAVRSRLIDILRRLVSRKGRVTFRRGTIVTSVVLALFSLVLIVRLFNVQVIRHKDTARTAAALHFRDTAEYPERGEIISADGSRLAVTTYVYTVGMTPRDLHAVSDTGFTTADIVKRLAEILELPEQTVAEAAARQDAVYVPLKKQVPRGTYEVLKAFVKEKDIGGIAVDVEMQRYYPQPALAPEVIGFSNRQSSNIEGVIGLEAFYNSLLSGQPGFRYGEVDNYNKSELYFSQGVAQQAARGGNLQLSLNTEIQQKLETELEQIDRIYNNRQGSVGIVMNPKTGAILAMGQSGSFDPNQPMAVPAGLPESDTADWNPSGNEDQMNRLMSRIWLNRAISESYEPGSTYKAITTAIALEEKAVSETELFSDEPIRVEGWDEYPITCSIYPANHGQVTMEQALWYSCNPVLVQIAQRIGIEKFYEYVQAFGHLEKTGIDLPAEGIGLNHDDPNGVDLAVWSFGEQSTVTPIQLINSFCALGNGGVLMQPYVVDRITDAQGRVINTHQPKQIRRVVSEATSEKIRAYMRGVITDGTAETGEVWGYQPVGKTSTSSHGEQDEEVVVSFCSLAPADDPEIAVLIILYEPQPSTTSQAAQYVSARVMAKALKVMGVAPRYTEKDYREMAAGKPIQPYGGETLYDAQINAVSNSLSIQVNPDADLSTGSNDRVAYQYPESRSVISGRGFVYLSSDADQADLPSVPVPDFSGLTLGEALDLAEQSLLNVHIAGGDPTGAVQSQSAPPSETVKQYSIIQLTLGSS